MFGSGKRIKKNNKIFHALGNLDELNSYLGICVSLSQDKKIKNIVKNIQETLFILQAELGGSKNLKLEEKKLKELEKTADKFGGELGVITKFTISGGSVLSAHLDYARALARRAERQICDLEARLPSGSRASKFSLSYMNRLSSLLFVLARYANKKAGAKENNPKYK